MSQPTATEQFAAIGRFLNEFVAETRAQMGALGVDFAPRGYEGRTHGWYPAKPKRRRKTVSSR